MVNIPNYILIVRYQKQLFFISGPFNSHETQIWLIKSIAQLKSDVSIIKKSVNANNQLLKQLLFDNHPENDLELDKLILQFPIGNETVLFEMEEKLTTDHIANKYLVINILLLFIFNSQ